MGPLNPLFWTSCDIFPWFQSQWGSLIHTWWKHMCYTFHEIHLWCNTCWPLSRLSHSLPCACEQASVGLETRIWGRCFTDWAMSAKQHDYLDFMLWDTNHVETLIHTKLLYNIICDFTTCIGGGICELSIFFGKYFCGTQNFLLEHHVFLHKGLFCKRLTSCISRLLCTGGVAPPPRPIFFHYRQQTKFGER